MARVSPKLRSMNLGAGQSGFGFWCPGCEEMHVVRTAGGPGWTFDGNLTAPTFSPSVLVQGVQRITEEEYARIRAGEKFEPKPRVCHSFVTAGTINYCGDCTHALNGQSVPLPDLPSDPA